ncbi:AbrB/MazE/SpoVT family DNA-binding domain-containing protein [Solidesulfovibrio sp. C21]|uniref:AbrB/MazE/SpoVT family DNA-binding domain-containing protein n=1 Tax=Solidesulfovibrio sp. C21 TaxID=3398613 RepID=UPI0039FD4F51
MHTTNLRKVGGSIMLAVPPAILDLLHLQAGSSVGLAVENNHLVVKPTQRPRYTLDELLEQCDASAEISKEDHVWLDNRPIGSELL